MKNKFLLIAMLCFGFIGCKPNQNNKDVKSTQLSNKMFKVDFSPSWSGDLHVIVIDNCEYLYGYVGGNGGYVLCHKGNCNNSVHSHNIEKEQK